ncbi:MAG: HlyD family efflux transporter periplasmic adaptor subunit [Clostridiales bacterium]|nr:HlyD family efflux transporter periplasmic adaptor subunit [Clostridiales bacterium]
MTESGEKRPALQKRWLVLGAILLVALIFLIPFIQGGGARVDTTVEVDTETAVTGTIRETVSASGNVQSASSEPVTATYSGVIASVDVSEGDVVEAGDVLATYDTDDLTAQIESLLDQLEALDAQLAETEQGGGAQLTAETAGLVKAIYADRGDLAKEVTAAYGGLLELSTDGLLRVELTLGEDVDLRAGDAVTVTLGDEEIEGSVDSVNAEAGVAVVTFPDSASRPIGETAAVTGADGAALGSGTVASNSPALIAWESGIVSAILVAVGDEVAEGDPLVRCVDETYDETWSSLTEQRESLAAELYRLRQFREKPELTAKASGIVTDLTLTVGQTVEAEAQVCSITSTSSFQVQLLVSEQEIKQVQAGQDAELTFANEADEVDATYTGQVTEVADTAGDSDDETVCAVTVSLENAQGLQVGDACDAVIILDEAENAVLIPIQALTIQSDGTRSVEIAYGDGLTSAVSVEVGLTSQDQVQILWGVEAGDEVVVASRVTETTVFTFFNHEWVIDQSESEYQGGVSSLPEAEDEAGDS